MSRLPLTLVALLVLAFVAGCSSGDISVDDIKRNAQAQADWGKAHPGDADSHIEQ
jgi:hypothetical protein